ncbi:MAG: O-antigen ligase family protein [Chloroflexi bacterium]|nr:O-antigen ligase family protein [Chloroflexota bacterium]
MKATSFSLSLDKIARWLWAAALVSLPVTSFRYFPVGETTYERPLAFFPLALLAPVLLVQLIRGKTTFPRAGALTSLTAFVLAALAASLIGVLFAPVIMRGQGVVGRVVRAWATVFIGLVFFISAVWMNRNEDDLRFTVKWILAGFVLDVLWSGLQGATFYLHIFPKPLVTQWQRAFSMRELIKTNRINGMAYEPSWLAGQISTIYMPWLFASLLTRERATRFKWLEPVLLACAALLLLATFSRGGLVTVAATVMLTFIFVGREQIRAAWIWFASGFRRGGGWLWRVSLIVLVAAAITGASLFLAQKDYISSLWNSQANSVEEFIIQNYAGARAAYIWGAMGAYNDHPLNGVGLGASGFYIYNNLPDWALTFVPEIANQLSPTSNLYPNPKNLYVRLLAETGLIGFFLFLAFQFSILGDALSVLKQKSAIWRYLGVASIFTWIALIFYNMTQDSFATPNLWINIGILVGISTFAIQSPKTAE